MSRSYEPPFQEPSSRSGFEQTWRRWLRRLDALLSKYLRTGTQDWAGACHLAPIIATAVPIPGLGALIALALWTSKRGIEPEVLEQGREALNFQINVAVWAALGSILFILPGLLVQVAAATLALAAGLKTLRGEPYRYPLTLRIIE